MRSNLRQAHWGIIDQAISTGSNFVLLFLIARSVSAAEFGAFASGYALYMLAVGLQRASGNSVLTIMNALNPAELQNNARDNSAYAVGHGVMFSGICLTVALLTHQSARSALVVLALAFPLLMLQDSIRGLFFAQRRPHLAAMNDAIWAVVQFGALAAVLAIASRPPMWLLVATWAGGGVIAAMAGLVQARLIPSRQLPHTWLMSHGRLTGPLSTNYVLAVLPAQAIYLLLPAVSDLEQVGILRAAYLPFGPLGALHISVYSLLLTDAVHARNEASVRRLSLRVSCALAAIAAAWGVIILLLPASLGHLLMGATWDYTFLPRVFLAISLIAEAIYVGARAALGALQLPGRMVQVQLLTSPGTLLLTLLMGMRFGASGAAAGLMIGYWVSSLLMWRRVPSVRGRDIQPIGS